MRDIALMTDFKAFFQPCILKYKHIEGFQIDLNTINVEEIFILGYVRINKDGYIEIKIFHKEDNHLYQCISLHRIQDALFIYDIKWIDYETSKLFEDENVMILNKFFKFEKKDNLKIKDIITYEWQKVI